MGQWLVLLVVILFVGPLLISNLWGYLRSREALIDLAFRNTRDLTALEAAQGEDFLRDVTTLVPALVGSDRELLAATAGPAEVQASARVRLGERLQGSILGKARPGEATAPARQGPDQPGELAELAELQVVSAAGELLASSLPLHARGPDLTSALCLQRGRAGPATVALGAVTGGAELVVASPVVVEGVTAAVVCGRFRFAVFQRLLTQLARRAGGADVYLLDERRQVLAAVEAGQVVPGAGALAWLPRPAADVAWTMRGGSPRGADLVIGYAPVAGSGWGVVVATPLAETLADLEHLKVQAIAVFSMLMAVVVLAVLLAWRTLVRPLRALAETSEQIAAGAIGTTVASTVASTGPREIVELAREFNQMSLALRDARQGLEDRIAERTRQLADSRHFLELLLDSIDQRVVVTDPQLYIVKANAAAVRLHGRPLVGEPCYRAFEDRDRPCDGCPVQATFHGGHPASAERAQRTVDGQQPIAIQTYPVRDDSGQVRSVISISRVITQEKQLQAQLAFHEKMAAFGQLAAGIAHELGNPLASIDAQLQRAEADPDRARQSVPVVRKEVGRMSRLLRELVDFSRRKRSEVHLASVNQIVDDVLKLVEHDPRARGVELVRELAPELPGVRIVEDHLVQVLLNLGLNALDALGGRGRVVLSTRLGPGTDGGSEAEAEPGRAVVEVRVSDTGTGVPLEIRDRLFQPFHTTKAAGRGTGLGLFVSKRIVDELGGSLTLEQTGPAGTVFLVRLPVAPRPSSGRVRAKEES